MEQAVQADAERADAPPVPKLSPGFVEEFETRYPDTILQTLLKDRTTGHNIKWADVEYEALGEGYGSEDEITLGKISGTNSGVLKPRVSKAQERQSRRTKTRAEVFTPSWLVNSMVNALDREWFRHDGAFNAESENGRGWESSEQPVRFPKTKGRGWHAYVESPCLEITCGEAPFLFTRYDAVTGEAVPVGRRIGILDRKLRVVSERAGSYENWAKWSLGALRATYGYEFQGDNLLIARANAMETFREHCLERWGAPPDLDDLEKAAWVVSWNLWQMDGLTCAVPTLVKGVPVQSALFEWDEPKPEEEALQPTLTGFDELEVEDTEEATPADEKRPLPLCVIYDWENDRPIEFASLKGEVSNGMKKFYAVIGNPPYQEDPEQGSTRSLPLYDKFMDATHEIGERVELVTPARFLFDSGQTSSSWNKKMLGDRRFRVVSYEPDSGKVFSGVDIKGGIAVTYWACKDDHAPIGTFVPIPELADIANKAAAENENQSLASIAGTQCNYNFDELYEEHPDYSQYISGNGRHSQLKSNALERVPIFTEERQNDDDLRIYGLVNRRRVFRWVPRRYLDLTNGCLFKWKVVIPESNGSGVAADVLSNPVVCGPGVGFTQTFMCIGRFDNEDEAQAALKYVKTRFARTLLSILKNTQHNPATTWKKIPLQDFTPSSDIDWSKSVASIDAQLARKYDLTKDDVDFMNSYAKEMS